MLRIYFGHFLRVMFICITLFGTNFSYAERVVVYSARIEKLIKPMFDIFTKDTGIPVRFVTDKEGVLLARLRAEGKNTPADMLITTDAGNLWEAVQEGLLVTYRIRKIGSKYPCIFT